MLNAYESRCPGEILIKRNIYIYLSNSHSHLNSKAELRERPRNTLCEKRKIEMQFVKVGDINATVECMSVVTIL